MWEAAWRIGTLLLTPILTALVGFLLGKLKETRKQDVATKNGVKALLRLELIDRCGHYVDAEYIPPYGMENILTIYQAYVDCGDGDPSINHMVEQIKQKPIRSV